MKTKTLLSHLKIANKIVLKKASMPSLSNIALILSNEGLEAQVTDLDISYKFKIDETIKSGEVKTFLINFSEFFKYIQASEDGNVNFKTDDFDLLINTDKMTKSISATSEIWPLLPTFDYEIAQNGISHHAIAHVKKAMSEDASRPHLNGIYFDNVKNKIVATDGHRLHTAKWSNLCNSSFILPSKLFNIVDNITGFSQLNASGFITLSFFSEELNEYQVLSVKTVSGTYPNWIQFVPMVYKHEITGSMTEARSLFKKALKLVAKDKAVSFENRILTIDKNTTILSKLNNVSGDDNIYNPDLNINIEYLNESIAEFKGDVFRLQFNDTCSPIYLKNEYIESIIMPIRRRDFK